MKETTADSPAYWISKLGLKPHPEGGFYNETYRSTLDLPETALPNGFQGRRSISTAIYFLLPGKACSRLHRIRSDELWFFHAGCPLNVYTIDQAGELRELKLGLAEATSPQVMVPAGSWFGACPVDSKSYSLVSCTVAPGFDFSDFELGERGTLTGMYPQHEEIIRRLT